MRPRQHFTMLLFPLFVFGLFGCTKGETENRASNTPGLWEIAYKENRSYIFGAIHVGSDDMYPLPTVVDEAFANAKTLIVEADPASMSDLHAALFYDINGKSEFSLLSRLSKETADLLRAHCEENNFPLAKMDRMTTWAAWLTVQANESKKHDLGLSYEKGIDKYFVKKATNSKKTIVELETVRGHMELLARLDPKMQEMLLLVALRQAQDIKQKMIDMIAVWKSGNLDEMNRVYLVEPLRDEPGLKEWDAKFVDERNVQMTARIEKRIKGKDSAFIVVGAAHIPGEMGILKLLEKKGFTIRQVYPAR